MNTSLENKLNREISIPQAKQLFGRGSNLNDEIYLVKDIKGYHLPKNSKETKCIVMVFCEEGNVVYDTKGQTIQAEENDIIFLTNGQWVSPYRQVSDNYRGQAIFIDTNLFTEMERGQYPTDCLLQKLRHTDKIKISKKRMFIINNLFTSIEKILSEFTNETDTLVAKSITISILQLVLNKGTHISHSKRDEKEKTYQSFIHLVSEKKLLNLSVSKYCSLLHISQTRLEKIVLEFTGITPIKYIHSQLINYICILAETTSPQTMPNYKIAERTHFRSATQLSRFVKRELNMSLTKYRHLTPAEQFHTIHHTILDQISRPEVPPGIYRQGD